MVGRILPYGRLNLLINLLHQTLVFLPEPRMVAHLTMNATIWLDNNIFIQPYALRFNFFLFLLLLITNLIKDSVSG